MSDPRDADYYRTMSTSDLVLHIVADSNNQEAAAELDRRIPEPMYCEFNPVNAPLDICARCGRQASDHPWIYR